MSAFYEHAEKSRGAQRILSCSVMQRTAAWSQNGTGAGHGPGSVLDPPLPVDLWRQSFRGTTATGLAQPMVPRRLRNHVTWPGYRAAASGAAGGTVSKKRIDPFTAPSTGQSCEFAGRPRLAGEWPIPRSAPFTELWSPLAALLARPNVRTPDATPALITIPQNSCLLPDHSCWHGVR